MPNYSFRCAEGCAFDAMYSMSEVPRQTACTKCGATATRAITAPHLSAAGSSAYGLLERSSRSAHDPQTVDRLPARGAASRQPVTRNPLHARLPKP